MNGSLNASNQVLNIVELQNVQTSASGLSPQAYLSNAVAQMQQMVIFKDKTIATNVLRTFDASTIQVTSPLNLSNTTITVNGSNTTIGAGGASTLSAGPTGISLFSTTSAVSTAMDFSVNFSSILQFNGAGGGVQQNQLGAGSDSTFWVSSATLIADAFQFGGSALGAAPGTSLMCIDSAGTGIWSEVSTIRQGSASVTCGAPSSVLVTADLTVQGTVSASNQVTLSDSRWKHSITPISSPESLLEGIEGVRFTWKESGERDIGFLAQDVRKVLPEAVIGRDPQQMSQWKILPVLVEVVKGQQKRIEALEEALRSI